MFDVSLIESFDVDSGDGVTVRCLMVQYLIGNGDAERAMRKANALFDVLLPGMSEAARWNMSRPDVRTAVVELR